jgi:hypothetical protein
MSRAIVDTPSAEVFIGSWLATWLMRSSSRGAATGRWPGPRSVQELGQAGASCDECSADHVGQENDVREGLARMRRALCLFDEGLCTLGFPPL